MSDSCEQSTQLRGDALEKRIVEVICELRKLAEDTKREFVFNASQVARLVPTTRRTLAKHNAIVEATLESFDARRRMVTGEATAELLRDRNQYLSEDVNRLKRIIDSFSNHHIDIYKKLYEYSIDVAMLMRPILEEESKEIGRCVLCGHEVPQDPTGSKNQ